MALQIPESLRKQLSEAGRKGGKAGDRKKKSLAGKKSWALRVLRARRQMNEASIQHRNSL